MPNMTPEQEAQYALDNGIDRGRLSMGAQLAYDRLRAEREAAGLMPPDTPRIPRRSSPEVRAAIAGMFTSGTSKYARPFNGDNLAGVSILGGDWQEYSQVVLQVAILDTLLSIEEKLTALVGQQVSGDD